MSFTTINELRAAVKDTLHKDSLPTVWDGIIAAANARAYRDILQALLLRGWTKAQIDGWDSGADFQRSQGLFWALTHGAVIEPGNASAEFIKMFDIREELKEVYLLVDGETEAPEGAVGQAASGPLDQSSDFFGKFDADDPRRDADQETRF